MSTNLRNFTIWAISVLLGLAAFVVLLNSNWGQRSVSQDISFSQFLDEVDHGTVRNVSIQGQEIRGTYVDGRAFSTYAPNDPTLVQRLYSKRITITARPVQDNVPWFVSVLVSWLPFVALIGVWIFLSRRMRGAGPQAPGFFKRRTKSDTLNAKHWRCRADEARATAEQLTDPESKRRLLDIADGYEYVALKTEERSSDSEKSK